MCVIAFVSFGADYKEQNNLVCIDLYIYIYHYNNNVYLYIYIFASGLKTTRVVV